MKGHVNIEHDNDIPNPERIKEILAVVSDKVPDLLTKISDVLYGPEQAKKYAKAISIFYKDLKDGGMTEDQAFELTKRYMSTLNIAGTFGDALKHG